MWRALFFLLTGGLVVTGTCCAQKIAYKNESVIHILASGDDTLSAKIDLSAGDKVKSTSDSSVLNNKLSWHSIFTGFSYRKNNSSAFSTNPLIEIFNFNTVEGFNIDLGLGYRRGQGKIPAFTWQNNLRYGFSNERFNLKTSLTFVTNQIRSQSFQLEGGRYVYQFNRSNPIHSFINSYYSLALRENYLKLYGSHFGRIVFKQELFEGLYLDTKVLYEEREPLSNSNNFSFRKQNLDGGVVYTSNDPEDFAAIEEPFLKHQAMILDVKLKLVFKQQYIPGLDLQIPMGSEYPDITLNYKKGINAFGSDVNYNFASINIGQNLDFGFFGVSSWDVNAGSFFKVKSIQFADYQHFNGNQTIFISYSEPFGEDREPLNTFQLLDYYRYSTTGSYWVVHSEHHFNGYIMNKIPFIQRTGGQLVAGLNFLQTDDDLVHFEFSAGLENIYRVFRIDFVTGYNNIEKIQGAFRLRLELTGRK